MQVRLTWVTSQTKRHFQYSLGGVSVALAQRIHSFMRTSGADPVIANSQQTAWSVICSGPRDEDSERHRDGDRFRARHIGSEQELMKVGLRHFHASLVLFSAWGSVLAQDDPTAEVEALTLQWTALERQRDALESGWRDEQPVLEQQLSLLERERRELSDFLEQTENAQDEVEERRIELLERQSMLEQQQSSLERELQSAVVQVQTLYGQLPPPMAAAWDEHLSELKADFLTTSERLQVLLEMLGHLDDFDRRLSLYEEVMALPDGQEHLVREVYLGLGYGWYVSTDGSYAGAGRAAPAGWQWQTSDEAEAIGRVMAILERRQNPELTALPVALGDADVP